VLEVVVVVVVVAAARLRQKQTQRQILAGLLLRRLGELCVWRRTHRLVVAGLPMGLAAEAA
jgi:hypothetical protein